MLVSIVLTSLFISSAFAAPAEPAPRAACVTGLHLLVARGTGADQATGGSIAQIYQAVLSQVAGSDASQIVYPANTTIVQSAAMGVNNMRQQITSYAAQCPKSKIVLIGYSQGALVIGDLLTGNGISGNKQPLDAKYQARIASIVQIADPAQVAKAFLNSGTGASSSGRLPRSNISGYNIYKGKIVGFCAADDAWCASGSDSNANHVHGSACTTFRNAAVSYITSHK